MTANPRRTALAFLIGEHLLTPPEAEQALIVAAGVLRSGLDRLARAAASGRGPDCAEAAHALKGNLLNLGLSELAQRVQWAGDRAQAGDTAASGTVCRTLVRELESITEKMPPASGRG
jgi:HPt (histidine-containing phosphotransfer) domain-containing protein